MADLRQLYQRAQHFYQKGKFADAAKTYQKIVKQQPKSVEAVNMYGISLAQAGDIPAAAQQFSRIIELDKGNVPAYENLARALMQMNRYPQAQQAIERALTLSPRSYNLCFSLGGALMSQNKFEAAREAFLEALAIKNTEPQLLVNLATVCTQLDHFDEAARYFDQAILLDPKLFHAHLRLGQLYLRTGRYDDAMKAFSHAINIDRNSFDAVLGYADALQQAGRDGEAYEQYLLADRLGPGSQNVYTKMDKLILHSGTESKLALLDKLNTAHVYEQWQAALDDARGLASETDYYDPDSVKALMQFFANYDPSGLQDRAWWREQLSAFGERVAGHDKILRGIHSAVFSWSLPDNETLEKIATFIDGARLYSYGSGSAYWERLLQDHFGVDVVATDFSPRHSFLAIRQEDYSRSTLDPSDVIFLAWIIRDDKGVFNLLDQFSPGQKLVLIGEPPDEHGIPRICGSPEMFDKLEREFELVEEIELVNYSMLNDTARLYTRRQD